MTKKERDRKKAIERSRAANIRKPKKAKSAADLERLRKYKIKQLLFLKFNLT